MTRDQFSVSFSAGSVSPLDAMTPPGSSAMDGRQTQIELNVVANSSTPRQNMSWSPEEQFLTVGQIRRHQRTDILS
jgi:hypothetical protein